MLVECIRAPVAQRYQDENAALSCKICQGGRYNMRENTTSPCESKCPERIDESARLRTQLPIRCLTCDPESAHESGSIQCFGCPSANESGATVCEAVRPAALERRHFAWSAARLLPDAADSPSCKVCPSVTLPRPKPRRPSAAAASGRHGNGTGRVGPEIGASSPAGINPVGAPPPIYCARIAAAVDTLPTKEPQGQIL